jgi:Pro-kumamolisin, activation domain/Bacterial Ig-like domain (group 3)
LVLILAALTPAQENNLRPLIVQAVDDSQLTTLKGNTHPLARAQFDRGAAPPDLPMQRMLLVLKRSDEQESVLRKLLDDQQDKASPNYHKWLTPEQFGRQFGPADQDIQAVTCWLQMHGFQIGQVTKGRTVIEFSGTAAQVQEALHTSIHKFVVNGEAHWANATDPQIPAALAPVVAGVNTLHNFLKKPQHYMAGVYSRSAGSGRASIVTPLFTFPDQQDCGTNCYALGPADFATIYNVLPLWQSGVDGSGQTIAIVGRSNINKQDVSDFRTMFGLPANDPKIILNGPDPGINGEETEADIDLQWSGAVARNATIDYVVSESTETTDGVDLSAVYVVDNNLAPVMSESFGECELGLGTSGNQFFSQLWEQAAAQGITAFVSSGDSGSAGCDFNQGFVPQPAQYGLAVSGIASTPFNVAVGGTDFNDFNNPQNYWNATNDPTTQASAKGYIPETTWNDSCTNGIFATLGLSTNAETNCNDSRLLGFVFTIGGGGGASNCTTNSQQVGTCSGGYAKPSWQSGVGVPNDGKRDIPDVSLFASNGFVGNFYVFCERDLSPFDTCNLNVPFETFFGVGGTSVSAPALAGIMALVNQQTSSRQGNANYVFYKLAAQQSSSSCNSSTGPASTCVFNDVTQGTIAMPCAKGKPNCTTSNAAHQFGVLSGYSTTAGYDLATGLGSVNAANLVNKWSSVTLKPSLTTFNTLSPATITHGQGVNVSVTVAPQSGSGAAPTGDVSLIGGPNNSNLGIAGFRLSNGSASGTTNLLPGGTYNVIAHYGGDGTYAASDSAPMSVTVNKEASQTSARLITFDPNTGRIVNPNATSAVYGSPYLLRVDVTNSSGTACAPNPIGESACPSGAISLTDNGAALDGGTFVLNSFGYTEDQLIQLNGGSHNLHVAFSGDNSFNSSAGSDAVTITPAATTTSTPLTGGSITVGVNFNVSVTVNSQGSGAAPGGTIQFLANGNPLTGNISYSPTAGSANSSPSLGASLTTTVSMPGSYSLTATYSGDANYTGSTSPSTSVKAQFPAPTVLLTPSSFNIAAGASLTLTATVMGSSKTLAPTGTMAFSGGTAGGIPGTVSYATVTDANGNLDLQAKITFNPTVDDSFAAAYSGDSNYPMSQGFSSNVTVTGNDFGLFTAAPTLTVIRGGQGGEQLQIGGQSNYTGTINFTSASCSGLPRESSCTFSPPSVTGTGSTFVTISTMAPHAALILHASTNYRWVATLGFVFAGMLLLPGIPVKKRSSIFLTVAIIASLAVLLGCGGGGGSGGGPTDPGTPTGSYNVTVTATSGSLTHTASFTLKVQ